MILSGGAFNSPQLLMLSGLGPADELRAHGIAVRVDLPGVGRNLSEHARVPIEFAARGNISFLNELRIDRAVRSVMQWAILGNGAFATQINSCNIVVRTDPTLAQPDIQLMSNPVRMDAKIWWPLLSSRQDHRITADAVVLHPESRGKVTLRSSSPADKPRIWLNVLATDRDLATARRGVQVARRIYSHGAPIRASSTTKSHRVRPFSPMATFNAYIRARAGVTQQSRSARARWGTGFGSRARSAPAGAAALAGLRVVDAFGDAHRTGRQHQCGRVIMIAEKAADLYPGPRIGPRAAARSAIMQEFEAWSTDVDFLTARNRRRD